MTNTNEGLRAFWHPVALESDMPERGLCSVVLLGEPWVVARLPGGLVALRDQCPHRKVPLSAGTIVNDQVECRYHGYRFGADGRCTLIPALDPDLPIPPKACVDTALVAVRFGMVWLCLADQPADDLLDDRPFHAAINDTFVAGPFRTRVSAGTLTDNFLDAAHFPFLHADTFGADDDGRPTLTVNRVGWRVTQTDLQMVDGAHLEAAESSVATYTVAAPFTVELRLDRTGGSDFIWSFVCPVDDDTSVWWMVHAYPLGGDADAVSAALALQTQVGVEDLWILEQMLDPTVPLDVTAEVHTKADQGCLAYRRMLIDLAR
jgi:phenylpropionate dioxygenase-like ring-hydroxylating dioxygenase large terminal subunit